ncbi:LYR motif containing protein 1 isoform X2 [Haplochromis burtoni]|uniref:LYR motif containing protein 1 isoform X2 n=1 Tax=Haplochromis burtoni TaxID=8153 RepID=UPI0003BC9EA6|nr:LYR motif containing protein 1 isoform X2 [Haplochromis burtoni]
MTASTRTTVLSLYMRVFRIARTWQAQSGVASDTETERKYILQEARTLFRRNQKLTEQESIRKCIEEYEARIEIDVSTTHGTGNSEGQEATSTAAPEETGQTNLLTVT